MFRIISAGLTSSAAQVGRHKAAKAAERTITRIFPPIGETDSLAQQFLRDSQELYIAGSFVDAPVLESRNEVRPGGGPARWDNDADGLDGGVGVGPDIGGNANVHQAAHPSGPPCFYVVPGQKGLVRPGTSLFFPHGA